MEKFYIIATGIFMALIFTGCSASPQINDSSREFSYISLPSKEEIEDFISANWQNYGYKQKPNKYIALSFDDGPCPPSASGGTEALLATLGTLKVRATFFVIGSNVRNNKKAAQEIFKAGHELANHSDSYISLGSSSIDVITSSLNAATSAITEITGYNPRLFRAPNLNHGENLSQVCKNLNMALIDGIAHNDWDGTGHTSASIKNSVLAYPNDGGIILLHENNTSKGNTMAALPDIIAGLREKGFWIMTVSELAVVKGKTPAAGMRYSSF
ncbi:MAG: polysaccharide deacetylase family protein [Treponema sp.]|nr:polysaccharide deacetylase family protein [Treponema sp.]MCL2252251.1 polysaccharide deacetylase family protein [Treponema sp.]